MKTLVYYHTIRAKHVERLLQYRAPRSVEVLYAQVSYDKGDEKKLERVARRVSPWRALVKLMEKNIAVVEVNEPLYIRAAPNVLTAIFANYIRPIFGRKRFEVVSYAIENFQVPLALARKLNLPLSVAQHFAGLYLKFVASNMDRLAFGTEAALANYGNICGRKWGRVSMRSFAPMEPVCPTCSIQKVDGTVVFLGALEPRKGILQVMAAWPRVGGASTLLILGKGERWREVISWAEARDDVSVELDPSRARIHEALASSCALVLPSQKNPSWKEQIGLPILEGLSHGCRVVTTTETGIADWLRQNGHYVLEPNATADELAAAMRAAALNGADASAITSSLPREDGRYAAAAWLWGGGNGEN